MKRILFAFIVCLFLFACNQTADKLESHEHIASSESVDTVLVLNNGAKWKADSTTDKNVINLKTLAENFRIKPFPTLNEYRLFSADLTNGISQLVQQCKMTGPDHEELHHWLEPILNKNKELKNVSDTSAARKIFETLDERIDNYRNYFELK